MRICQQGDKQIIFKCIAQILYPQIELKNSQVDSIFRIFGCSHEEKNSYNYFL